jgi:hypothetical protein
MVHAPSVTTYRLCVCLLKIVTKEHDKECKHIELTFVKGK